MATNNDQILSAIEYHVSQAKNKLPDSPNSLVEVKANLLHTTKLVEILTRCLTPCAICQDQLDNPRLTPCQHIFCNDCIVAWLAQSNAGTCPTCRTLITRQDLHPYQANVSAALAAEARSAGRARGDTARMSVDEQREVRTSSTQTAGDPVLEEMAILADRWEAVHIDDREAQPQKLVARVLCVVLECYRIRFGNFTAQIHNRALCFTIDILIAAEDDTDLDRLTTLLDRWDAWYSAVAALIPYRLNDSLLDMKHQLKQVHDRNYAGDIKAEAGRLNIAIDDAWDGFSEPRDLNNLADALTEWTVWWLTVVEVAE